MRSNLPNPLSLSAVSLGQLIPQQRLAWGLSTVDAARYLHLPIRSLHKLDSLTQHFG